MELLERRVVSRKTPGDGRLEITQPTAQRIERLSAPLSLEMNGAIDTVALTTMPCTCRGAEKPHVHYFLQSERFKSLVEAEEVEVQLDATSGRVRVDRAQNAASGRRA